MCYYREMAIPFTSVTLGIFEIELGWIINLEERLPDPSIKYSISIRLVSAYIGISSGKAKGVTPPIIMPVKDFVSSGEANDNLETPMSFLTVLLTLSLIHI